MAWKAAAMRCGLGLRELQDLLSSKIGTSNATAARAGDRRKVWP
jgi:hypothetical protein